MNSIKYGFFYRNIYSRAYFVTANTANASLPSTRVLAIPIDIARGITPSDAYWSYVGVDIAYLLLRNKNNV